MASHFSILAWKIPWTEEPGGLQSMGLQRVGQDCTSPHKLGGDDGELSWGYRPGNERFTTGVMSAPSRANQDSGGTGPIRTQEGHPVPSWEKGELPEGIDGLADTKG